MNKIKIAIIICVMLSFTGSINAKAGQTGGCMQTRADQWSYTAKYEKDNGNNNSSIILHTSYYGNSDAYVSTYAKSSSGFTITTYKKTLKPKNSNSYPLSTKYDLFPEQNVWLGLMSSNSTDSIVYTWNYQ